MLLIILQPSIFQMNKTVTAYSKFSLQFLVLLSIILVSCDKSKIQFGQDFVDNSYSNIILVDTLSAVLSTVHNDSVPTSSSGALLTGVYTDPAFGKVKAKSFFEIRPPAITTLAVSATFDSVVLILRPNKTYYGDTTATSQFSIYQLTNQIVFPLNQGQFFNTTDFAVDPSALGSTTTVISPNITDSVFIRLSDTKGQDLFNLYKSNDYIMQSAANFIPYFKGLQVTTDAGSMQTVYGFNDSVIVRLHYHESGLFTENKTLDFTYYNSDNTQFNNVSSDRTGTPLAAFTPGVKELPSALTNNRAYLQYLTGFLPKIKFPTIRSLLLKPDYAKILKAILTIKPVQNTYTSVTPLPPQLLAYTTDQLNAFGTPLGFISTSGYQTGSLFIDPLYGENTAYTYDVTSYLQQQILISSTNQNGLLLSPGSPAAAMTLNRLIIGDEKNDNAEIQLKLYYVSVTP